MAETIAVAVVFLLLLGLEWRYQVRSLRTGTTLLALLVWLFCQPNFGAAGRRVSTAPPEARVTQIGGEKISVYLSGVTTMLTAIGDNLEERATCRLLALGVLLWLACSPHHVSRVVPKGGGRTATHLEV